MRALDAGMSIPTNLARNPNCSAACSADREVAGSSNSDGEGDEPVVAGAVDGGGEPHAHRAHPAIGEGECGPLVRDPAAGAGRRLGPVILGRDLASAHAGQARSDCERLVAAGERFPEGLDRGIVGGDSGVEVSGEGDVVPEGEVDDPVALHGGIAQDVEVGDLATADLGARGGDRLAGCLRASEPEHLVAVGE